MADTFFEWHPTTNFLFLTGAIGMSVMIQHPVYLIAASFLPAVEIAPVSWGLAAYTCYLLIPTALHIKEAIQWHISRSRI